MESWRYGMAERQDCNVRYIVARYYRDPEKHKGKKTGHFGHRETRWWRRFATIYEDWDSAYAAREKIITESVIDPYLVGDKIQVWTLHQYSALAVGFKHPADRDYRRCHPKPPRTQAVKIVEKWDMETELGRQLKAAGL